MAQAVRRREAKTEAVDRRRDGPFTPVDRDRVARSV